MIVFVKVKPRAREVKVNKIDETHFEVWVKEPASGGLANNAAIKALAENFDISRIRFRIISGKSSRQKKIEIL
ncbi:MAG: DUF167 domain-containing protein [Candidatus Nealsonbacteria bacterium]|nr:DUF167 domain-containing protein [Candidatus Nealsonbacteria bacterium]